MHAVHVCTFAVVCTVRMLYTYVYLLLCVLCACCTRMYICCCVYCAHAVHVRMYICCCVFCAHVSVCMYAFAGVCSVRMLCVPYTCVQIEAGY